MMSDSGSERVELLHPIYLDTDMSMAFAAALTGGVALKREEVEREDQSSSVARNLRGNLRLFDVVGIGGGRENGESESVGSESRMVRQHTEASLFITLNDELRRTNQFVDLDIATISPGDLVSVSTGPAVAPLRRVMDQIVRLLDFIGPVVEGKATFSGGLATADENSAEQTMDETDEPDEGSAGLEQARSLFLAIKEDLDRSGLIDIVVQGDGAPNLILTLDKRFLGDTALELLHTSNFTVVGKVTQVWPTEDNVVNLHRRSVMSLLPAMGQVATWGTFTFLASAAKALDATQMEEAAQQAIGNDVAVEEESGEREIQLGEDIAALNPAVSGPTIQILPLAICA